MRSTTFNGTRLKPREWIQYRAANGGVELLEASFEQFVYERHIHDTYAIGVPLRGVQRFWCCGATHDCVPGDVVVIPPGEAHDGESGTDGSYKYRMLYLPIDCVAELASQAFDGSNSSVQLRDSCRLRDPALARDVNAAWKAMSAQPASLATEELFGHVVARLDVRHDQARRRSRWLDDHALRRVRDYLCEHVDVHVRLDDLASSNRKRFRRRV